MKGILQTALLLTILAAPLEAAQTIYKSVNSDGTIVYSDKPPADGGNATVIQQKPANAAALSTQGQSAGGTSAAGTKNRVDPRSVTNADAVSDAQIQRSAYGPGIPQPSHVAAMVPGPVEVERSEDGTKTFRSDGRVIMMEKKIAPSPIWDDHVSAVSSACGKLTNEYDPKADLTALSTALRAGHFADVEARLEALYRPVRVGHCSDRPIWIAFTAFDDGAQELELRYSQWLAASPKSVWPRLARGSFLLERAMLARGSKFAKQTSAAQFAAMRDLLAKAKDDLDAAQRVEPEHSIAAAKHVVIARYELSRDDSKALFERYRALLPRSYALVMAYSTSLQLMWGGNAKELIAFASDIATRVDLNPDFALMPSYAVCLLASDLRGMDHGEDADKLKEQGALRYAGKLETRCYSSELVARATRNRQIAEEAAGPVDATVGRLPEQKHGPTFAEGRDSLDRQLLTQHGDADLYCRRAWYSYQLDRFDEARDFVTRGIAINAQTPTCVREQSKLSRLAKPLMPSVTLEALAAAVKESGRIDGLHFEYGLALIDATRMDAAEAQFTEAIALNPQFNGAWYRRGWVRARTGQSTLALADLDKAIEIAPRQASYWAERGHVHQLLKQYDDALSDLAHAQRQSGENATTEFYLAAVYEAQNDCRRVDALRKVAAFCATTSCRPEQRSAATMLAAPELRAACPSQVRAEAQTAGVESTGAAVK